MIFEINDLVTLALLLNNVKLIVKEICSMCILDYSDWAYVQVLLGMTFTLDLRVIVIGATT